MLYCYSVLYESFAFSDLMNLEGYEIKIAGERSGSALKAAPGAGHFLT